MVHSESPDLGEGSRAERLAADTGLVSAFARSSSVQKGAKVGGLRAAARSASGRCTRRDLRAVRRPRSTAEERHQRGVGFLRMGPADVMWAVLDLDDREVRNQLFVSQPGGGRLERQDPVGGTVDH